LFLKNCWYVSAWSGELGAATVARRILDTPVLLYRTGAGVPVAFLDRCPHRLVPLSAGSRVGDSIRCGYHGMVFGPDGRCQHIPGQQQIPDTARVSRFPVCERHGLVWIWMGDGTLADPELIPMVPWAAADGWAAASGYTFVQADYRLLTDNLLDLSHENYIHHLTIGNEEEETIASYPVKVRVEDGRVLHACRLMSNIAPPLMFAMMMQTSERINRWQDAIWTAPAINITDVGARPVSTGSEGAFVARILHLLTPESGTSTHYFWAHCRQFRQNDEALTESILAAHRRTFDEDKQMLELQQKSISECGQSVPAVALRVDEAPLRARRILNTLIKEEASAPNQVMPKLQYLIAEGPAHEAVQ
jgi:phenylpropionate dioxygenase-like ring-hydroxylating dioxygenase large terminal subunit